jgi:hypothetical protein
MKNKSYSLLVGVFRNKHNLVLLCATQLLTTYFSLPTCIAQAPQGIPYQAIARNVSGVAIANTAVKVRFSIRDSIATGGIKYQETHNPTTSALGLFSVNVGMGTLVSGSFSGINWGKNAKFLQVELNTTGGTTYTDLGTTQMMSVPYALYAGSSETNFQAVNYLPKPTIYSQPSSSTYYYYDAILYCFNLTEGGFSDWRMPTLDEVNYLRDGIGIISQPEEYWTKSPQLYFGYQSGGSYTFSTLSNVANISGYAGSYALKAICVR